MNFVENSYFSVSFNLINHPPLFCLKNQRKDGEKTTYPLLALLVLVELLNVGVGEVPLAVGEEVLHLGLVVEAGQLLQGRHLLTRLTVLAGLQVFVSLRRSRGRGANIGKPVPPLQILNYSTCLCSSGLEIVTFGSVI